MNLAPIDSAPDMRTFSRLGRAVEPQIKTIQETAGVARRITGAASLPRATMRPV